MANTTVELGPVQQTLFLPLLGRAQQTRLPDGMISDPKSVEIIDSLSYHFPEWEQCNDDLLATVCRTLMIDNEVNNFLHRFPNGTVVEVGCGLNTRFERLDNGTVRWFDLDLPDVIELRRRFFQDEERRRMFAGSVADTEWIHVVKEAGGPWFIVSEATIIFLDSEQAQKAISQIGDNFHPVWFFTDTTSRRMVEGQSHNGPMRHLPKESHFRWICDEPKEIEGWTDGKLKLMSSKTFMEAPDEFWHRARWPHWLLWKFFPWFARRFMDQYRLNLFSSERDDDEVHLSDES
ncbi:Tetracenomycin polyketide synthesis O-methyltransferase TcmP [Gracilariopsis chorda]|uniref:Tetracenomycin polyketide synthesis O-methyltransferase TcmP n=1 Tax=Gracilariopsis chorda TaxID=448386 RepID=A0A2V3IF94_9FLOR|nr:Tetracenomycin polyketide synthesis O-methyltransferase TcmP [Gracilariopsis chorda]|eukprot:PXF40744.1 Tetracenomycin polyketide synthesis O-methyltransferase TcmP [Gracilariopsis chorda]